MSATSPTATRATTEVLRFDLDVEAHRLGALRDTLSSDELARAGRFRFRRDAMRFVTGRGVLRRELARRVGDGVTPESLRFAYGRAGKPALRDHPQLHFNSSGAGGRALLAIAEHVELGVDLELVSSANVALEIAQQFLHSSELTALAALAAAERPLAALRAWTRKEAYVKALGTGLQVELSTFAVGLDDARDTRLGADYLGRQSNPTRHLVDIGDLARGDVATLCHAGGSELEIVELDTRS